MSQDPAPLRTGTRAGRGAPADRRRRRGDRGDSIAFVVVWPVLIVAVLVLTVHAFIVSNARAQAEIAASEGLRAVWRTTAAEATHPDEDGGERMARAAQDAVARAAAGEGGWRWWTPGAAEVSSDWCAGPNDTVDRPPTRDRDAGWVRIVVRGETLGPLSALWPGPVDTVYAVAAGPAVLSAPGDASPSDADGQAAVYEQALVPADLPQC